MTIHEAKGISSSVSATFARPSNIILGFALCESLATCNGFLINPVNISSVVPYSDTRIRITFDRPMKKNENLTDVFNYSVSPGVVDAAIVSFSEIIPESVSSPRYVDIVLDTEMTNGRPYDLEIATFDGPTDEDGNPFDSSTNTAVFIGKGTLPEILYVKAISQNRVDVVFTENMLDNSVIRDPLRYSFDKSLSVLSVAGLDGDTVQLVTSDQTPGELYTLTITPM